MYIVKKLSDEYIRLADEAIKALEADNYEKAHQISEMMAATFKELDAHMKL